MADKDPLNALQVVVSAPMSVPSSVFVRIENETLGEHSNYVKLPGFTATSDITLLSSSKTLMEDLDKCLSNIYSRRPFGKIITKYLTNTKGKEEQCSKNCKNVLTALIDIIKHANDTVNCASNFLSKVFNQTLAVAGAYSDTLLDLISEIIYKMTAVDQIFALKKSLLNDLESLQTFLTKSDAESIKNDLRLCKELLSTNRLCEGKLIKDLNSKLGPVKITKVVQMMWNYLSVVLREKSFVKPNIGFAYLTTLIFFLRYKPGDIIDQHSITIIRDILQGSPYIPLYHELALDTFESVASIDAFRTMPLVDRAVDLTTLLPFLREEFSSVSREIAFYLSSKMERESSSDFLSCIKKAFCTMNYTKALLRQVYCKVLANPPKEPANMKKYERAMRHGFQESDYSAMLQLLSLCRELHNLLLNNSPVIYQYLSTSIHYVFQVFVKHGLSKLYNHVQTKKEKLGDLIDNMRAIAGDFLRNEKYTMKGGSYSVEAYQHKITDKQSIPNPQLLELIRIQIQHITNPECEYMVETRKLIVNRTAYRDKELVLLKNFINESKSWTDLVSFDQTLTEAIDQSDFYFKEVQLDINGEVQFSAKASLPFNLCNYALIDYNSPEVTELIFYPLSIYDDAANVAISRHKSQLMYSEIIAEANQALDILTALISEFTFGTFRTFSAFRQLPHKMVAEIRKKNHVITVPKAYRLRTLITQNQFYFLGKNTNIRSLIASCVDKQLNSAVDDLYNLSKKHGLLASIAISHGLNALRDTHRLLVENGLPLMPFPNIERTGKGENHLLSFKTVYFENTVNHMFKTLITSYSLFLNPHRFMPPTDVTLPSDSLGKNNLGKIMQVATENTVAFVAMSHFTFFVRQCSEGTLSLLFDVVSSYVSKVFNSFLTSYEAVRHSITRISDAVYGSSIEHAYGRYDTAYDFLINEISVINFFKNMKALGNLFIAIQMLDEAMTIRCFSLSHSVNVLKSADNEGNMRNEINDLFDDSFKASIDQIKAQNPEIAEKLNRKLMLHAINILIANIAENYHTFAETSLDPNCPKLPPLQEMTGFAMVWSVLEFVFVQTEVKRSDTDKSASGLLSYGFGVPIGAAIIALATKQEPLTRVLSIGKKLVRAMSIEDDESSVSKEINVHLSVYNNVKAIFDWAVMFFESDIKHTLQEYEKKHPF